MKRIQTFFLKRLLSLFRAKRRNLLRSSQCHY